MIKLIRNTYFHSLTDALQSDLNPARVVYEMNISGKKADSPFVARVENMMRNGCR